METQALHWPLAVVDGVGLRFLFFNVWLEWRGCCLKFSVLLCCPSHGSLARKKSLLLRIFLSADVGIFGLCACSAPNLEYVRQKENPRNSPPYHGLGSEVPSQSAFFSLLFSLLMFVL